MKTDEEAVLAMVEAVTTLSINFAVKAAVGTALKARLAGNDIGARAIEAFADGLKETLEITDA